MTSRPGAGTRVRLSLPLSMAITRVMMVEAGGTLFGIPMDVIAETVRLPFSSIRSIKRVETPYYATPSFRWSAWPICSA